MAKRRPAGDGMVRRRDDGRWEGRIVIGHKENGEPLFRHVYAKTQKALLDKLHQNIECYRDVELTEDSRMTLGKWLDRWLAEYKAGTVRPSTLEGYRRYIEYYIKPQLGDKQISLISQQDIQRMYRRLKTEGRIHDHPEMNHQLSDSMVRHIHSTLHAALKDAVQAHVIPRNPTEGTTAPKPNYKPKRILTGEELDAFLAVVEQDEVWRDFFQTELMTGLRRGEIQTISTDHCSFTLAQKDAGREDFTKIPGGLPGVETRGELIYSYGVAAKKLSLAQMCRLLSENPAKLYGLYPRKGVLAPGSDADIVVYDPGDSHVIRAEDCIANVDYNPYEGFVTAGGIREVWLRGRKTVENGKVLDTVPAGMYLARGKCDL